MGVDQYNRSIIELKPDEEEGIFNDSLLTYFAEVGFNPKAKEGLREAVIDAAGDLINGDDYEDLFRSFILKLHPRANWLGRSTSPSPDFPTEVDFLLYEYPILMLRDRVLGLDTAIDRIRKTIASSGKVPNHLQNVICECKKIKNIRITERKHMNSVLLLRQVRTRTFYSQKQRTKNS